MKEKYCQSWGMPMDNIDEMYGINADDSKSEDYCKYCFANSEFTVNCSMAEMIEYCVPHMVAANAGMSGDTTQDMMQGFLPMLKR